MNRTEFLEILRTQLSGQMQEGRVAAHIRYYRDYMEEEMRKGRSEEEVLTELGDPRLIARTLLDTEPDVGQQIYESETGYGDSDSGGGSEEKVKHRTYKLDLTTWYGKVIVIAVAAVIIAGLVALVSVMLPVILVFCGVMLFISWLRRRNK